ncbi:MAG: molybdate ABC transporter substrate-binding protein [Lachnoanaerobaculum saburreum]
MKLKNIYKVLGVVAAIALTGCGAKTAESQSDNTDAQTTAAESKAKSSAETSTQESKAASDPSAINVFAAASLKNAMDEIIAEYNKANPDVKISLNTDSSGKLQTQIEEGFACDIFFSAGKKQMEKLKEEGHIKDGTDADLLHNKLCIVAPKDSDTKVTGVANIKDAKSISIGETSVPAGAYAREALSKAYPDLGITKESTGAELKDKLGMDIIENSNVTKTLLSVVDGFGEVGFVYLTDTYGNEDVKVIEKVDESLTGKITYPIARVNNDEADEKISAEADKFYDYLKSDSAKKVFEKYLYE